LKVVISNQSESPIYVQIREQIKEQILNGSIDEGTVLPSIRQLAKELSVSVITTTRAYSDLENEGFVVSVQGKGSIVRKRDNPYIKEQYLKRIEEGMETALATARLLGLADDEIMTMFKNLLEKG